MGIRTKVLVAFAVASLAWAGRCLAADADPLVEKTTALEKKVEADVAAKTAEALVADATAAADLYKEAEGKDALRDRALSILGTLSRVRDDGVVKASIGALGDLGDLRGARYLRGNLKVSDDGKVSAALEASLDAAKKLPESSLVEPLLAIVDASKNYTLAAKAIEVLGAFGAVKNKREKILTELTKTVAKSRPGAKGKYGSGAGTGEGNTNPNPNGEGGSGEGSGYGTSNQPNSARWPALAAALPGALNALTGSSQGTAEDWIAQVKEHKDNLKVLFVGDGSKSDKPDAKPDAK